MKRFSLVVIVQLFVVFAHTQPSQTYRPIYDNLMPVSPTAFQFLKYTEVPVSEYTGIPNISVPIYTISEDGLNIPISLNYHAGGIRVSQDAGWVGLGWDLTFGSVIQIINDQDDYGYLMGSLNPKVLPDYYHNAIPSSFAHRWNYSQYCAGQFPGYSWTPTLPVNSPQANFGFMIATDYYVPVNGEFNTRRVELFDYPEYDSEPDIFKANFLGHSISYIKVFNNSSNQFIVLNKKGYVIDRIGTGENYTWKITVPTGEVYFFEERTITENFSTTTDFWGTASSGPYKAATKIWMLTKILTKNKKVIQFSYSRSSAQTQFPSYSQKRYKMNTSSMSWTPGGAGSGSVAKIGNSLNCTNCYGETYIYSREEILTLSAITFPKGQVSFITSPRQDSYGGKKLDLVDVKSNYLVQSCSFNYSYFDATSVTSPGFPVTDDNVNKFRLKLNSVVMKDASSYQFFYNNTLLPRKNSFAQDYWGFYNGHLTNTSMVPNATQFNRPDLFNNSDNHSSRIEYAKAGTIEKIVYPTGGSSTFEYGLNEFDNYWVPDYSSSSNTISKGLGLRVNEIKFSEKNDNSVSKKTVYLYELGKAVNPKSFIRSFNYNTVEYSICGAVGTAAIQMNAHLVEEVNGNGFFSPTIFGSINGVGYSKVTRRELDLGNQDIGRVETYFHNNPDLIASSATSSIHLSTTLPAIQQYDKLGNGLVKETKYFDKLGVLVKFVENSYVNSTSQIYYGARIFGYGSLIHPQCYGNNECNTGSTCYCGWGFKAQHLIGFYPIFDRESIPTLSVIKDYSNGQIKTTTKSFSYDQYNQLVSENIIGPDNTNEITSYVRTYNATGTVRDYMMGANRLADIWRIETSVYPPNTYPSIKKSKTDILYKIVGDKFLEDQVTVIDRVQTEGSIPRQIVYNQYDVTTGNLREYTTNNSKKSILWGYNSLYPIAEVSNAPYSSVFHDNFEDLSGWDAALTSYDNSKSRTGRYSGRIEKLDAGEKVSHSTKWLTIALTAPKKYRYSTWVYSNGPSAEIFLFMKRANEPGYFSYVTSVQTTQTNKWVLIQQDFEVPSDVVQLGIRLDNNGGGTVWFDDVRLHPSDAMMSTYTHNPLIGISSQTDVNNRSTYYEYDNGNRLSVVRDQDRNVIRKICYNYSGQPVACSTFYSDAKTQTFTRNNCGVGYQGGSVTYSVPQGAYTAPTQIEADALAQNEVNNNGQNFANQHGACQQVFASDNYSNFYYSGNCQFGQTPLPIYVNVPAGMFTSIISQQDANNQAIAYAQNYANQNGTCSSGVDMIGNNSTGEYIYVVMTNTSTYEQYFLQMGPFDNGVFGNVPAGTYDIEIGTYGWGYYGFSAGCSNYSYGSSAYFYNVTIDPYCSSISVY